MALWFTPAIGSVASKPASALAIRAAEQASTRQAVAIAAERIAAEQAARRTAESRLAAAARAAVRMKAGFTGKGPPVIVDNSIGVNPQRTAEFLRQKGYNARSVGEIFGKDPGDPAILNLANTVDARVIATDRGRDLNGGFGSRAIKVDGRIRGADSVLRLLEAS